MCCLQLQIKMHIIEEALYIPMCCWRSTSLPLNIVGREDRNEFFMHSQKLPDLPNEAAMLDMCCTMCSGLSRLLKDGS